MIIIVSINFGSLDNSCPIRFLEGIFDIHINAKNANKSNLLQKINAFREKIIAITVLKSEFWSVAFYGHSFLGYKIFPNCIQKLLKIKNPLSFFNLSFSNSNRSTFKFSLNEEVLLGSPPLF